MTRKQTIYGFTESVTPPILFNFFRKTSLYRGARRMFKNAGVQKPQWHTVEAGVLQGKKIYFPGTEPWQAEMLNGTYDKFFFDYLKKIDVAGKTILDVGSHIGFHALCFAEMVGPHGHVLTFEPNPFNADRIAINLAGNKELSPRIELLRYALSSTDGNDEFLFADDVDIGMSSGSFIESADPIWEKSFFETRSGYKRMRVETKKIDSIESISQGRLKPDIIKIDVEGAESLVLQGAEVTISTYHPLLLLEVHSIYNMYEVMGFLEKMHYKTELLKKERDGRCFLAAKYT